MTKIKWVKFYTTGNDVLVTFNTETMKTESEGETHGFGSSEEAQKSSTAEVFIFWDNLAIGAGLLEA